MEHFAPGLWESVLTVSEALRVIVFFVCTAGLVIQIQQSRANLEGMARPLVRAIVIVALIATLPHWFEFTEKVFLSIADTVHAGYTDHPMRAAAKLRETVSGSTTEFSLRRIGESMHQAFLFGAAKLLVLVASVLQLPFLVLQFVLKLLCYLFLPVALALFMIPSQAQLAARYVQQTLAILAWPVGFAVTELVAYHLLIAYGDNLAIAYGVKPGEIDAASFASVLGGLLAGVWLLIGTLGTPFLMQGLICGGSPVSGGGAAALQQLYVLQQVAWMMKSLKTGGLAAPAMAATTTSGGRSNGLPPSPPPPAPIAPPPSPSNPAPAAASDPSGDGRAATVLALAQLPAPKTTM